MHSAGWTSLHVIMLSSIQLNHFHYSSTSFFEVWVVVVVDFWFWCNGRRHGLADRGFWRTFEAFLTLSRVKIYSVYFFFFVFNNMRIHQLDGLFFSRVGNVDCRGWFDHCLLATASFIPKKKKSILGFLSIKYYLFALLLQTSFSLSLFHAFCDGPSYFVFFCDVSVVHCSMQLLSSEFSFFLYRYPHGYCYAYQAITTGSDQSSCDIEM